MNIFFLGVSYSYQTKRRPSICLKYEIGGKSMQVLGVREMTGEYEGKPYHKVAFHVGTPFDDDNSNGYNTEVVKVKYDDLTKSFNKQCRLCFTSR